MNYLDYLKQITGKYKYRITARIAILEVQIENLKTAKAKCLIHKDSKEYCRLKYQQEDKEMILAALKELLLKTDKNEIPKN
jgi:hypothetical protein